MLCYTVCWLSLTVLPMTHLSALTDRQTDAVGLMAVTHSAAHDSSLSFDRQTDAVGLRKNYS